MSGKGYRAHSRASSLPSSHACYKMPSVAPPPPLSAYAFVAERAETTASAVRRVVALRREGVAWNTIAKGLGVSACRIRRIYEALPEELK